MSQEAQHEFVWIEQTALTYLLGHQDKEDFSTVLQAIPRVIYSSDLGQTTQMDIKDWIRYSAELFTELHLSEQRKSELLREHVIKLLS